MISVLSTLRTDFSHEKNAHKLSKSVLKSLTEKHLLERWAGLVEVAV